jgi:hypothetical protein
MDTCIICGDKILSRCRCMRTDTRCVNGHEYHWSPANQEWHEGESNHGSTECCIEKKVIIPKDDTQ